MGVRMTEKRFEVGNLKIQDTAPKGRVYLLDMQGGVNALCSLINGLNDKSNRLEKENEQLKQRIKELEIENTAQSDAIDGLQETLTHLDLGDVE